MRVNPQLTQVSATLDAFNTAVAAYRLRNAAWLANPHRNSDPTTSLRGAADDLLMAWADLKQAMRGAISSQSFGAHTFKLRPAKAEQGW